MKLNKPTFVVSTRATTLTEALKKSPQAVTVWIRSGKYKNRFPLIRSSVTYEAKSVADAKKYVKRFVFTLTIPKTHTKLSVLKSISGREVSQLISHTRGDKLIRSQTHDFDRFKSKKTFIVWEKRGKTIYTLIDRGGKLLGIIWFSRKTFKKYNFTFAIRTYPPIRGKGVAYKFLVAVYQNFKTTHKKPNLWLKTEKNNLIAIKLYRSFGFKTVSRDKKNTEEIMVLKN